MSGATWINRFVLPALAFKAVVIGGGYATGRELVEFFLPSGAVGGVCAMLLAAGIWSAVCALTFLFAFTVRAADYQSFFRRLLGPFAFLFEALLILYTIITLSVFGAAASAIGASLMDWPSIAGTLLLACGILVVAARGSDSVEGLFKYVSVLLYCTYAAFLLLCVARFGGLIGNAFAHAGPPVGWVVNGVTYASYNVIGATMILPALRHQRSRRDALLSGLVCGPLAMLPALVFFVCLSAFGVQVAGQTLPSDYLLRQLQLPLFHWLFQLMIFAALLECSVGNVHAINERVIGHHVGKGGLDTPRLRLAVTVLLLVFAMGIAQAVGLVDLIAKGYRMLAYLVLLIFILPLVTLGVWRLMRTPFSLEQTKTLA
jgi:uncharacterized membrane protein YkvI